MVPSDRLKDLEGDAVSRIMITDLAAAASETADHATFKQINPFFPMGYHCLKDVNTLELRIKDTRKRK